MMTYRSQPLRQAPFYQARRKILLTLSAAMLLIFAAQAARLTLWEHDDLADRASDNLISTTRLSSPRGNIFDRNESPLATNVRRWSLDFRRGRQSPDQARETLHRIQRLLGEPDNETIEELLIPALRWQRRDIVRRAEHREILPLLERMDDFTGLRATPDFRRDYPTGFHFSHIIGYTGAIQPGETEVFDRPRYLPSDFVGRTGLERAFQDRLAGIPGLERVERDARYRQLGDPEMLQQALPGQNLKLTVDAGLQARAMELLRARTGTILIMEAESGAISVCASRPAFHPDRLGAKVEGEAPGYLNLAVRGAYPPGSTFKIVGAAAALRAGISPERTIHCGGAYWLQGWDRAFHCAHRNGHGPVNLVESLEGSCNVYYFQVAEELGAAKLREMAEIFGFSHAAGTDMPGEKAGSLPSLSELRPGERTNFSIGQGRMLATPLQVARAFAGVATGWLPTPHVVESAGRAGEEPEYFDHPRAKLPIPAEHLALIREGLRRVVANTHGTAHAVGFPDRWDVMGKTGSVERGGDKLDAWFVGIFGNPAQIIVVHVEDADGHGGEIAGPLAKKMIAEFLGEAPKQEISQN